MYAFSVLRDCLNWRVRPTPNPFTRGTIQYLMASHLLLDFLHHTPFFALTALRTCHSFNLPSFFTKQIPEKCLPRCPMSNLSFLTPSLNQNLPPRSRTPARCKHSFFDLLTFHGAKLTQNVMHIVVSSPLLRQRLSCRCSMSMPVASTPPTLSLAWLFSVVVSPSSWRACGSSLPATLLVPPASSELSSRSLFA